MRIKNFPKFILNVCCIYGESSVLDAGTGSVYHFRSVA